MRNLDEHEVRASAEAHLRRAAAINLDRRTRDRSHLKSVKAFAKDCQIAERARSGLILVGEWLCGEAAGDAERRPRSRRRDRRANHGRKRDGCPSSHR